jgi:hypothetical protein
MKPIDAPNPDRDAQVDRCAEILDEAVYRMASE